MKKKQKRSHDTHFGAFEKYALHFFLNVKKANNVNNWHMFYPEFRDWLESEVKSSKGKQLSYSYMNHTILSVNNFMTFLSEYNLIDKDCAKKMGFFGSELIGHKNFDSVIEEAEYRLILPRIRKEHEDSADFFMLLYATGMRINEAKGLPFCSIYNGKITGLLQSELEEKKLEYVGYLILESQAESRFKLRDETGHIARVALKGRKKIEEKNSRIIPVFDKDVWNMLVKRYLTQQALYEKKEFGTDKNNYILFDGLATSSFTKHMVKAYEVTAHPPKSAHDCRHSFCTLFVGKTRSLLMARTILGHKSSSFERYLHIYEQMTRTEKQGSQIIDFV
jgi:integrase